MKSFEQFCTDVSYDLGRVLKEEEIEFLCWLYERHIEETNSQLNQ